MATNDLLSRYKKQKKAEAEKDITHNNNTSDSPFTLSKYREMKKNNQVNYDTQIVNDWFNNADKYKLLLLPPWTEDTERSDRS